MVVDLVGGMTDLTDFFRSPVCFFVHPTHRDTTQLYKGSD